MSEQQRQITRVADRIADAILAYQVLSGPQWRMEALRAHVERVVGVVAPASPDRVLRLLRAERRLNYRVVNRRASLYEWAPILPPILEALRQPRLWSV